MLVNSQMMVTTAIGPDEGSVTLVLGDCSANLPLAEKIAEATGGETTIRVYPGGELGKGPVKQYDRVLDGVADIVYALPGYTASQFKKTLLVELPGVVPGNASANKVSWKNPGSTYWEPVFSKTRPS